MRAVMLSAVVAAFFISTTASATLIFAGLVPPPDINSVLLSVSYTAFDDQLTVSGIAADIDPDSGPGSEVITGGTFDLTAEIDGAGSLVSGSLTIGGTVASLGFNSGTLLTADIIDFGFPGGGGDPLQFLIDITGGDAASLYPQLAGASVLDSNFSGSFLVDFSNAGLGLSDVAPIPEPSTAILISLGLLALAGRRRMQS